MSDPTAEVPQAEQPIEKKKTFPKFTEGGNVTDLIDMSQSESQKKKDDDLTSAQLFGII